MGTNLNEIAWYDDEIDRWASNREAELRRLRYRAWIISTSLRVNIRAVNKMGEAFARLAPHVARLTELHLELGGVPLEMQREVLAITRRGGPEALDYEDHAASRDQREGRADRHP